MGSNWLELGWVGVFTGLTTSSEISLSGNGAGSKVGASVVESGLSVGFSMMDW